MSSTPPGGLDLTEELEAHLRALLDAGGGEAHVRSRERAARWLLDHPDLAHRRLIEIARRSPAPAVIELLPRFGRPESVGVLEEAMTEGGERIRWIAAEALGRHPLDEARSALLRGLKHEDPVTLRVAARGLAVRGDPGACPEIQAVLHHPDASARYQLVSAAAELGCLSRDELARIAGEDSDPDIRALADRLLSPE